MEGVYKVVVTNLEIVKSYFNKNRQAIKQVLSLRCRGYFMNKYIALDGDRLDVVVYKTYETLEASQQF